MSRYSSVTSLFFFPCCLAMAVPVFADRPWSVRYDAETRRLSVHDPDGRAVLGDGVLTLDGDKTPSLRSDRPEVKPQTSDKSTTYLTFPDGARVALVAAADRVTIQSEMPDRILDCTFAYCGDGDAIAALDKARADLDRRVLITTLGPASVPQARSLFAIQHDTLLTAEAGEVRWEYGERWTLHATDPAKIVLRVNRDYYRNQLGIAHYTPLSKRGYWRTAPMVCMTWYAICGDKRPQNLELLKPEIDWAAKHLLPYARRLVFQLDDNYHYNDDKAMRALSDYIRAQGMIPGVWLTPFSMLSPDRAKALATEHPDWFLRNDAGTLLTSFAGKNWGFTKYNQANQWQFNGFGYTVNVMNPQAVEAVYQPAWRQVSETWNYDFFKIDGQNQGVIQGYRGAPGAGGIEGYRRGLELARQVIGPDKFINACWGIPVPLEAIGRVDGSRTGGDTGHAGHAGDVVVRHNYLNNIVWWCDPDAAAELHNKPVATARLNAVMRVLTGQQFLTDDYWTKVSDGTRRVWQQSLPTLDIHPANLYPISNDWNQYDTYDLRIAKPWGTYDVVGLLNYSTTPVEKTLDLSRLPLDANRVHVYDYFSRSYLGEYDRDARIAQSLDSLDARVFAIVPTQSGCPVLLSTSRHISQGGLDLACLAYRRDGKSWLVSGTSEHVVAGDPYELAFHAPDFVLEGSDQTHAEGPVRRAVWTPEKSGQLNWTVRFHPRPNAAADSDQVSLAKLDLSKMSAGWGKALAGRAVTNNPLSIGGKAFADGVGTHADSALWIDLHGAARRFNAEVGVDDRAGAGKGSVRFMVILDGERRFDSGALKAGDAACPVDLDLSGARQMLLIADSAGDGINSDHANWAEARIAYREQAPTAIDGPLEEKVILTPTPGPAPAIHGPRLFGARPGRPFIYRIPCTGQRPIAFTADGLPPTMRVDAATGVISGNVPNQRGEYLVTLGAGNPHGKAARRFTIVVGDKLALTPPMGWNSWYIHYHRVTEQHMRRAADQMIASGMADVGYMYVNIDDCWMKKRDDEPYRDAAGAVLPNAKFPDIAGMVRHIHDRGLRAGTYISPGPWTCAGYVGSFAHERQDAERFAACGFDFLKYDWCSYGSVAGGKSLEHLKAPYQKMGDLLQGLDRDVVLNLCQYGMGDVWNWGANVGGHCWRTTGDLGLERGKRLPGFYSIGFSNMRHYEQAGPGAWNDPDYLLIGWVGDAHGQSEGKPTSLTAAEQYSYMSMWSLMAAPLVFSGDMARLDAFTLNVLCNPEVIAINQDALGKQARPIAHTDDTLILAKPLEDGSLAVGLFNLAEWPRPIAVTWDQLGLQGPRRVRDVWRHKDLADAAGAYTVQVGRHNVMLLRLWPRDN